MNVHLKGRFTPSVVTVSLAGLTSAPLELPPRGLWLGGAAGDALAETTD